MTENPQPQAARLAEIEARLRAATPGPWAIELSLGVLADKADRQIAAVNPTNRAANMMFLAAAPADLRYLLDLVAEQAQEIARLKATGWRKLHDETQKELDTARRERDEARAETKEWKRIADKFDADFREVKYEYHAKRGKAENELNTARAAQAAAEAEVKLLNATIDHVYDKKQTELYETGKRLLEAKDAQAAAEERAAKAEAEMARLRAEITRLQADCMDAGWQIGELQFRLNGHCGTAPSCCYMAGNPGQGGDDCTCPCHQQGEGGGEA